MFRSEKGRNEVRFFLHKMRVNNYNYGTFSCQKLPAKNFNRQQVQYMRIMYVKNVLGTFVGPHTGLASIDYV